MSMSVRVSAHCLTYLENHTYFSARCLWPWLGPPMAALRYVVFSGFSDDVTFSHSGLLWRIECIPKRQEDSRNYFIDSKRS